MKRREYNWFLVMSIMVLSFSAVISLIFPREIIHIRINTWHLPFLDTVFKIWTLLGDGLIILAVVLVPLFIKVRFSIILFTGYAISGLSAQLTKLLFFSHSARPVNYFHLHGIEYDLYRVPGVELHNWNSFPSGHTATAFGVFFGLSLILNSRWGQLLAFVAALGVAFSRLYLSQHFLMDVTAGAVLGLMGGYLGWWWIGHYDRNWLNKPIQELLVR